MDETKDNVRTFVTELSGKGKRLQLEVPLSFPFEDTKVHEYTLLLLSSFGISEVYAEGKFILCDN